MADKQNRSVDLLDHLLRALGVILKGRQRILHGVKRVVTTPVQLDDDLGPMGRATPKAMDEDDARLAHAFLLVRAAELVNVARWARTPATASTIFSAGHVTVKAAPTAPSPLDLAAASSSGLAVARRGTSAGGRRALTLARKQRPGPALVPSQEWRGN
jgi:hypothetical protein